MPGEKLDTNGHILEEGDGVKEACYAYKRKYLSLTMVRRSAKRVCELVMKTRRFARERAAAASGR